MPNPPLRRATARRVAVAGLSALALACVHSVSGIRPLEIRVATYNIRAGNDSIEATAEAIRSLGADVVGLEEVDVHWSERSRFEDQAKLLGEKLHLHVAFAPIYELVPLYPNAPPREFGVALLSRYPIESLSNRNITRLSTQAPNPVPEMMPGFLEATLDVGGTPVRVYVTHLDYRADPAVRTRQVSDMLGYINGANTPAILLGDLNAEPSAPELRPLFDRLSDAWRVGDGADLTYPADEPKKRIDYVLVSERFRVRAARVPVTLASDHRPVVVDLILLPMR